MSKEPDAVNNQVYDEIRRRVEMRYQRRAKFFIHFTVFVALNLFVLFTYGLGGLTWTYSVVPVSAIWLLVLVAHGILTRMAEVRDDAVEREIEREREWQLQMRKYAYEQAQDEDHARLSDEGELVYPDDVATEPKRKRGQWGVSPQ